MKRGEEKREMLSRGSQIADMGNSQIGSQKGRTVSTREKLFCPLKSKRALEEKRECFRLATSEDKSNKEEKGGERGSGSIVLERASPRRTGEGENGEKAL